MLIPKTNNYVLIFPHFWKKRREVVKIKSLRNFLSQEERSHCLGKRHSQGIYSSFDWAAPKSQKCNDHTETEFKSAKSALLYSLALLPELLLAVFNREGSAWKGKRMEGGSLRWLPGEYPDVSRAQALRQPSTKAPSCVYSNHLLKSWDVGCLSGLGFWCCQLLLCDCEQILPRSYIPKIFIHGKRIWRCFLRLLEA